MRFSDVAILICVIAAVFAVAGLFMNDLNQSYPSTSFNDSLFDKYDKVEEIEESAEPLKESIEKIQNEETGWKQFVTGLAAVPNFILGVPSLVFKIFGYGATIITEGATDLNVPIVILSIMLTAVLIFMIFAIVSWWHRSRT